MLHLIIKQSKERTAESLPAAAAYSVANRLYIKRLHALSLAGLTALSKFSCPQ
jgi:hypothetical protein